MQESRVDHFTDRRNANARKQNDFRSETERESAGRVMWVGDGVNQSEAEKINVTFKIGKARLLDCNITNVETIAFLDSIIGKVEWIQDRILCDRQYK